MEEFLQYYTAIIQIDCLFEKTAIVAGTSALLVGESHHHLTVPKVLIQKHILKYHL